MNLEEAMGGRSTSSFVDLQVNGFAGIDFSSGNFTAQDVLKVADALEARGTGAFLATVITSPMETYLHALPEISEATACSGNSGRILGIHLEGPFISREDGAVGAHPKASVMARALLPWLLRVAHLFPGALKSSRGPAVKLARAAAAAAAAGMPESLRTGLGVPELSNCDAVVAGDA